MIEPRLIREIEVHNELGEGVTWDSARQCIWWTDIQRCRVFRYFPEPQTLGSWATPERLACLAPVAGRDELVVGFASGFAYFDPESGRLERLHEIEGSVDGLRLNDGRTDRQGRFWAGSMVESDHSPGGGGSLYCLDERGDCRPALTGLRISNGLCWSPDGRTMYHTDTPTGRIDRYPFDTESGTLGQRSTFAECDAGCSPDGATVDADGYLWSAQWGGSKVIRYSPAGSVDMELHVPASQPTCVAFGGRDLSWLFVTSAREGLDDAELAGLPGAGNVFVYETNTRGLKESPYRPIY